LDRRTRKKKELYVSDYRERIEDWCGKATEDAGMLWRNRPKWKGNFIEE
jgi:hypothetical protein